MDNLIEAKISNLVETQFPEFYRTDGPTFVLFLKKYYEWLEGYQEVSTPFNKGTVSYKAKQTKVTGNYTFFTEQFAAGDKIGLYYDDTETSYDIFTIDTIESDTVLYLTEDVLPSFSNNRTLFGSVSLKYNPNYHIRRLREYDDVDTTTDEFILFFKEKYLKNIQFTTRTNTRQLIKHCLDLYRSKGSPRSVDLLFRLVFGVGARTYYPGEDVFKLSDGKWEVPKYLELSLNENTVQFVNKQITGLTSGATAFAEAVIRRTIKGKFIDVLYMSAIKGDFITGELINTSGNLLAAEDCPVVIGSLSELLLDARGVSANYVIGDIVDVYSANGEQAKARVASISDITGIVEFDLVNGGYGYTDDSQVLISEKVFQLDNVTIDTVNNFSYNYFNVFENIIQPSSNISYSNSTGQFANGLSVNSYYANASLAGTGTIMSATTINATHGVLLISDLTGTMNATYFTAGSNTANVSAHANTSGVAETVDYSKTITIKYSNLANTNYAIGETVYQINSNTLTDLANGVVTAITADIGANSFLTLANTKGIFSNSIPLYGRTANLETDLLSVRINLGVANITSDFFSFTGNRIYGNNVNTHANITVISQGTSAGFSISNTFNYTETVSLNTDYLINYKDVFLNANAYGLPGANGANLSSNLIPALSYSNVVIGKIVRLTGINIGSGYNLAPIIRIYEPQTYPAKIKDINLTIDNASGIFEEGELITQEAVSGRGLVTFANSTFVQAELLRYNSNNFFVATSNATTQIVGENSAVTANVISIEENFDSEYIGLNAVVEAETKTSTGSVTDLQILDSGFGFFDNEIVSFEKAGLSPGNAQAVLGKYGRGTGFYKQKGGFLSDTKKLFDGIYYQDYSYEIRSSITLKNYEEMLRKLLHIPGTKYFGAFVYDSETSVTSTISSKITQE